MAKRKSTKAFSSNGDVTDYILVTKFCSPSMQDDNNDVI